MITVLKSSNITWVDVMSPTRKDIEELKEKYHLNPMSQVIWGELLKPTLRSKVEDYGTLLYMVLHFPVFDHQKRQSIPIEVDYIIGHNLLITVRYQKLPPLEEFHKRSQNEKSSHEFNMSSNAGHLIYYILKELFEYSLRELDHIRRNIDKIEESIFIGDEKRLVSEILGVRRDILGFRKAMKPQKATLESLIVRSKSFFGDEMMGFFTSMLGDYMRVWSLLENYKETIDALQETNDALLTTKTNEVIKTLTIFSVFGMAVSIIGEFFSSYSFAHMPLSSFLILSFFVVSVLMGVVFHLRKRRLL